MAKESRRREEELRSAVATYKQRIQEYNSLVERLESEL